MAIHHETCLVKQSISSQPQCPEGTTLTKLMDRDEKKVEFYEVLVTRGSRVPGQSEDTIPVNDIKWLDKSLIADGLKFYWNNLSTIYITSLATMTLGLMMKSTGTVFYRLSRRATAEGQLQNALATQHGFHQFYQKINDSPEEQNKFFVRMWKLHAKAAKMSYRGKSLPDLLPQPEKWEIKLAETIRKDLDHIPYYDTDTLSILKEVDTWIPECPLNQLDISLTTLNTFLALWLHPAKHGIKGRKELDGLLHIWAVIGRLFGVRDEFNICLTNDRDVFKRLYLNAVLGSLKNIDSYGVHLLNQTVTGIGTLLPILSIRGYLYATLKLVLEVDGYAGEHLWKEMTFKDKFLVGLGKVYYFLVGYIPGAIVVFNWIFYHAMNAMIARHLKRK